MKSLVCPWYRLWSPIPSSMDTAPMWMSQRRLRAPALRQRAASSAQTDAGEFQRRRAASAAARLDKEGVEGKSAGGRDIRRRDHWTLRLCTRYLLKISLSHGAAFIRLVWRERVSFIRQGGQGRRRAAAVRVVRWVRDRFGKMGRVREILWKAANVLQNKLTRAQYLPG